MGGWIGVDLDGTLAEYHGWQGANHIGRPVPLMANRVRQWIISGIDIRIFTARANIPEQIPPVEAWCEKHFGKIFPITNRKDFEMIALYDDKCIQLVPNTGVRVDGEA